MKESLEKLWICPPLAFARFGQSPIPLENFHWASNDYAARGTAETVIEPSLTFEIDARGNISAYLPEEICFRDDGKWRPVCPFFELHGKLSDGSEGPLGLKELERLGIDLAQIKWTIHAGNRKAFHYTLNPDDHVDAVETIAGNDSIFHQLKGVSPAGSSNPIVPDGSFVEMGGVQIVRPNPQFPEIRIRLTPPRGLIYAPTNVADRNLGALLQPNEKKEAFIRQLVAILNPDSDWAKWKLEEDPRTNPGGLYAQEPDGTSLGFLDDSGDGTIMAEVSGKQVSGGKLQAHARFTFCPQDFQPDRRPFVSIADGLTDLVRREEVSKQGFMKGVGWLETETEIGDLMQRVRETMEASNLDHQNLRSKLGNAPPVQDPPGYPFEPEPPRPGHPLPLTEFGRDNHARFLAYEVFKQRLAQRPELFERWIRKPTGPQAPYDKQMPALMRGSDSYPMTISQRQYNMMANWLKKIEADTAQKAQGKAAKKKKSN